MLCGELMALCHKQVFEPVLMFGLDKEEDASSTTYMITTHICQLGTGKTLKGKESSPTNSSEALNKPYYGVHRENHLNTMDSDQHARRLEDLMERERVACFFDSLHIV